MKMMDDDLMQERRLDDLAQDESRVDGIDALNIAAPDEEMMTREDEAVIKAALSTSAGRAFVKRMEESIRDESIARFVQWLYRGSALAQVPDELHLFVLANHPMVMRRFGVDSMRKLGKALGKTGAALSARFKVGIRAFVSEHERCNGRSRPNFQSWANNKPAALCEKYAAAAKGNSNRKKEAGKNLKS